MQDLLKPKLSVVSNENSMSVLPKISRANDMKNLKSFPNRELKPALNSNIVSQRLTANNQRLS